MKERKTQTGFRRVPGGYRRSDVNAFILSNDKEMASAYEKKNTEIEEMRRQIEALTADRNALTEKLAASEKNVDALRLDNDNQRSEIALLRMKVEERDAALLRKQQNDETIKNDISEIVPNVTAAAFENSSRHEKNEMRKRTYTFEFPFFKKQNGKK